MRKISLVIAGLVASYNCFADLGQISVKSYLDQPLYATIPVYNVAGGDYANLSINLASGDKFKNYGIAYDSNLGFLQFKVINQGSSHYLQITSSRSIDTPVLNLLLHYQENNNDFYRQYTILLNPIQYGPNGYAATSSGVVGRNNPIAIQGKVAKRLPPKYRSAFTPNYSNQFVKDHLNQFNKDDMTFNMKAGDSLYIPARFVQLMYPKAKLPINQIILAIGLANYHNLRDQNYIYESSTLINLPVPEQMIAIPTDMADAYIWKSDENTEDKLNLLSSAAGKFDKSLQISGDPTLFNNQDADTGVTVVSKADASKPVSSRGSSSKAVASAVKKPFVAPVISYEEPSILDQVMDYKLELLGVIGVLLGLLLLRSRKEQLGNLFKRKPKKGKMIFDDSIDEIANMQPDFPISKPAPQVKIVEKEVVFEPKKPEVAPLPIEVVKAPAVNVAPVAPVQPAVAKPVREVPVSKPINVMPEIKETPLSSAISQLISDEHDEPVVTLDEAFATRDELVLETPAAREALSFDFNTPKADPIIHDDVIDTLKQILEFDDSRDDIRLKLFELYLGHNAKIGATKYHDELNQRLDSDDPIRVELNKIATKYNFTASDSSVSPAPKAVTHRAPETSLSAMNTHNESPFHPVIEPSVEQYVHTSTVDVAETISDTLDKDIVDTLEQILLLDPLRHDIRLKLFELYSGAGMPKSAHKYYKQLDDMLDIDDPIRKQLTNIPVEPVTKPSLNSMEFSPAKSHASENYGNRHNELADERAMEFNSNHSKHEDSSIATPKVNNDLEVNPFASASADQQINLATMYYHIEEFAKSRALLNEVINSATATYEQKESAMKIMEDYGL